MTEQELKATVATILSLEAQADALIDAGDHYLQATEMIADAQKLEDDLQQQGFILGEQHTEVLVYRCDRFKVARDLWLIFDTANGQWRQEQEQSK
jgi:hypothetical protein